jgi:thiaminase/transcriptional activator TenA
MIAPPPPIRTKPGSTTYSGEEFHNAVSAMIAATDEAAETASSSSRERMHAAFVRATQLEWMFWDSAFRLETWPV